MIVMALGHSDEVDAVHAAADVLAQCQAQLKDREPQGGLCFIASSVDCTTVAAAIHERYPNIALVGCTSDGEFSSQIGFTEDSVVLALFTADRVGFGAGLGEHLALDTERAVETAVDQALAALSSEPVLCWAFSDGLSVSSARVVEALKRRLGENLPIFGGASADQWDFKATNQLFGGRAYRDALSIMLISGPLDFDIGVASGWKPLGHRAVVTSAQANKVSRIGEESALDFYRRFLGSNVRVSGEFPLAVFEPDGGFYLRAPYEADYEDGSLLFFADVPLGASVQIAQSSRSDIIAATKESAENAFSKFKGSPQAVFCVSCAARKNILGTKVDEEQLAIRRLARDIPFLGYYSFGEIAPPHASGTTRFHNETFLTLVMGEADA